MQKGNGSNEEGRMIDFKKGILFAVLVLSACTSNQENTGDCKTQSACLNDPNCLCWCSVKCGYRQKTDKDHPMYKNKDRNGKFCYCKEWDYKMYEDNCIQNKNVQQPEGAK